MFAYAIHSLCICNEDFFLWFLRFFTFWLSQNIFLEKPCYGHVSWFVLFLLCLRFVCICNTQAKEPFRLTKPCMAQFCSIGTSSLEDWSHANVEKISSAACSLAKKRGPRGWNTLIFYWFFMSFCYWFLIEKRSKNILILLLKKSIQNLPECNWIINRINRAWNLLIRINIRFPG